MKALITHNKWIYLTALLQMILADGMAAIVGTSFGKSTRYRVLHDAKSVVGTLTFFAISSMLLVLYSAYSGTTLGVGFILGLAAAASLVENVGVRGLDNLLVPILIASALVIIH